MFQEKPLFHAFKLFYKMATANINSSTWQETHECKWTIQNYAAILLWDANLSAATKRFSITCGNGITYTWELGYRKMTHTQERIAEYLKLIGPKSEDSGVQILQWKLEVRPENQGPWEDWISATNLDINRKPVEYVEMMAASYFNFSTNADKCVHTLGTLYLKSRLVILVKKKSVDFKLESIQTLQKNYAHLLADKESADIKIVCSDGIELTAHKLILSAQNPVFASMLTTDMIEKQTGVLNVDDISSPAMNILLQYFYSGKLDERWADPNNIVEFTYAAGKYQISDILKMLDNTLGITDHEENTMSLLSLVGKLGLSKAEDRLLQHAKQRVNNAKTSQDLFRMFEKL